MRTLTKQCDVCGRTFTYDQRDEDDDWITLRLIIDRPFSTEIIVVDTCSQECARKAEDRLQRFMASIAAPAISFLSNGNKLDAHDLIKELVQ